MIHRLLDHLLPFRRRAREHAELARAVEHALERRQYCERTVSASQLARLVRQGHRYELAPTTACKGGCGKPILLDDDDALVCINCGGRNRRAVRAPARAGR